MTTDILHLDNNFNTIITEQKIKLNNPEHTIYKNKNRYKHNDIIYIPNMNLINKTLKSIFPLPTRYRDIKGTKRFKELKDFFNTFNLINQYLAPHSENKKYIALDRRYIMKSLGNRVHNKNNYFFDMYFKLEIKGIKGMYTSGYSLSTKGIKLINAYSKVTHKDKLENILIDIIEGKYKEQNIENIDNIKNLKEIPKLINNSYIEIPKENINALRRLNKEGSIYQQSIKIVLKNYVNGKLYYNASVKPYGRTYSYIHSLKREVREILFSSYTELDLESAAQSILYKKVIEKIDSKLETIKNYIDNKVEIRERLSTELNLSISDVKKIIQIITFSKKVPNKKQVSFFKAYKDFPHVVNNSFLLGLSKDFEKIDEYLVENLKDEDYKIIKSHKGSVSKIDVRVFTFQNIESRIMQEIQSRLKKDSFHLHDAVYVKDITKKEILEIHKYVSKLGLMIKNSILVYKKYTKEVNNSIGYSLFSILKRFILIKEQNILKRSETKPFESSINPKTLFLE